QRAGGVDDLKAAGLGVAADFGRDAVCAVDDTGSSGGLVELFNEDGPATGEVFDDVAVMDDLAAYVDGRAIGFESQFNDVDGAHDASAKAPRLEQIDDLFVGEGHRFEYTVRRQGGLGVAEAAPRNLRAGIKLTSSRERIGALAKDGKVLA